ncbi:hypothetical protein DXB37_13820 [Bacteroides uniformis]|uniref:Uncharacterized protein n=1 Tax=Bacteroides uniformis TaxID=820 RepID=A0A3E5EVL1_BACUN|nr:hypothetical protein DXB37_13820 [Bacteroides uniformis]
MCDEMTDCHSSTSYCKTTAFVLQRHCKPLCSVAATNMQCDCNCFAVALQHVCSDAAKGMQ